MKLKEEWRDILSYEGLYQVSNYGRVKSLERKYYKKYPFYNEIWGIFTKKEKILKLVKNEDGYLKAQIYKNKIEKAYFVHRLVAQVFIPNPNDYPQINHKNGIKDDNRVQNLEWCTASQNLKHAFKIGIKNNNSILGEKHHFTPFKTKDILEIRKLYSEGHLVEHLAKKYDVWPNAIKNIVKRNSWKHV